MKKIISLSTMKFNGFYVIYFSLIIEVNHKRTFNFEKGCICDMDEKVIKKNK